MKAYRQTIEINGRNVLMTFGMRFLQLMGDKYSLDAQGMKMRGMHYASILTELQTGNPVIIFDMIRFATDGNPLLKDEEIEDYVFEQLEDEEAEKKLFQDFFAIFKKVPGAKKYVKELEKLTEPEQPSEETSKKTKLKS
ncbi:MULTISPECIES: tail assembly chaperone [unclassified Facklamia]|uniref:tail assembly chaperone n=1 Tax=Aerococcaceae TaxID=186827 RepID=UPI0013BE7EFC|nr:MULTISPECIES: tail assembly chaperone [unclassified Facklamia]NEW65266.1 hypothetical protein [Facklamia sp. 252]NEW68754.1 hypothetical protein [Facklamia sp. 253]QQD66142.1 hypothetical protein JDW14_03280 [Aerococcaceae bacterium zg-252]